MNCKKIGGRLKDLRGDLGQSKFAELFGVHQTVVGQMERGDRRQSVEYLLKVAEHFGVSLDFIVRGDMSESSKNPGANNETIQRMARELNHLRRDMGELKAVMGLQKTA